MQLAIDMLKLGLLYKYVKIKHLNITPNNRDTNE